MMKYLHIPILLLIFAIGIVGFGHPMTRAKLAPPFPVYIGQDIERVSKMRKTKELKDVLEDFRKVHGNNYDYSLITKENYVDTQHSVMIKCNTCGLAFPQKVYAHKSGQGCPRCANKARNLGKKKTRFKKVCGVGINDYERCINSQKGVHITPYKYWHKMLQRCYDKKHLDNHPTYIECYVCKEWLFFSNFKRWFDDNYVNGYALDKDILFKGNKVYSPDTCCFVPQEINSLIISQKMKRGELPIGVTKHFNKYKMSHAASKTYGLYNTKEEAFEAYKQTKELYIKEIAQKYYNDGKITQRIYDALVHYQVDITD